MKRIVFFTSVIFVFFTGCNTGPDYKSVRKEVIDVHDTVMNKSAKLIQNKIRLDRLIAHADSVKQSNPVSDIADVKKIDSLMVGINAANEQMENWMHQFEPDAGEKSNQEATEYFKQELIKIRAIDSTFSEEINKSDRYLSEVMSK